MAGMFFSLKEVADKLGKSEEDVRELVKVGRLREFRDGPNLLFKVDEVNALMSDTSAMGIKKDETKPAEAENASAPQTEAEAEEILLAPDIREKPAGEEIQLTDADTQIVEEGIKVLGETDTVSSIKETGDETFGLGDTKSSTPASPAKESSLEEIEKDVSLDTFGSGSGLLDLSLQADDTSLGGILDEIYTTGPDGKPVEAAKEATGAVPATEGSAMEVAAEADQIMPDAQFPETPVAPVMSPALMTQAYAATPDALSNAMGIMLIIPLLAVVYTAIVAFAAFSGTASMMSIVKGIQGLIWYIAIGMAVASGAILGIGAMMGGEKKPKAPKPPKVKKVKPPKPAKEKKGK